jgi:16S rRNA (uracil1498-N3)-methyltransferase
MRLFVPGPLQADTDLALPPGPSRHAQVRRVQPGDLLRLFDGGGCDWPAEVRRVGRSQVDVRVGQPQPVDKELPLALTLAVGMPANERMDTLVEKATELGVATLQPLLCERAVLRLDGERAERKRAHWQAVAEAACEQCGRARVPVVAAVRPLPAWLAEVGASAVPRVVLGFGPDAQPLAVAGLAAEGELLALSGPEGGLAPAEEAAARAAGFRPVSLGPRVLRADTAPLALLAWFSLARNGPGVG